jgi:hypothetical protein
MAKNQEEGQMKKGNQMKGLLKELSRDPRLKVVIAKAKHHPRGKAEAKVESATGFFLLALSIASRFAKKKNARTLNELGDLIYLLVQVSLMLKENIFDRPEVKEFISQRSKEIYLFAQECAALVLPKPKMLRPATVRRPG